MTTTANATVLQIADSIVAELNAAELSHKFKSERLYVPDFDLEDVKELRVTIVPREVEYLPLDRVSNKLHATIDIAIQKKFSKGDAKEIDPLVMFVEQIADYFRLKRLNSYVAARCVKVENSVLYSSEHWQQFNQFTSLLTLTFELSK
ncbi:hypothetical protein [Novipirellula artificiosorum]|uniref:Uncharacterized protein n=1 Tax=Novipirellula artificiosorum TaxID=2528016 RepID=A0A5C6DT04_9BACT|nr:hypothetical protein [Novipirellula artificiosorum]TWU39324.1 hypothetical protein Poly41_21480 [Novipirellula artificiosorum]